MDFLDFPTKIQLLHKRFFIENFHHMNYYPELYPGEWETVLSQHEEREKRLTTRSTKTTIFLFKKTPLAKKKTTTVSDEQQDKKPAVVEPMVRISLS